MRARVVCAKTRAYDRGLAFPVQSLRCVGDGLRRPRSETRLRPLCRNSTDVSTDVSTEVPAGRRGLRRFPRAVERATQRQTASKSVESVRLRVFSEIAYVDLRERVGNGPKSESRLGNVPEFQRTKMLHIDTVVLQVRDSAPRLTLRSSFPSAADSSVEIQIRDSRRESRSRHVTR